VVDFSTLGECLEHKLPQMLRARDANLNQEIVGAANVVHPDHLGAFQDVLQERLNFGPGVALQPNRGQGLQLDAERGGIDLGMKTPDDALP